jgi:glyoxylase I family protein
MLGTMDLDLDALEARRAELRARYLLPKDERPPTSARGVHHVALICSDVERTIRFYRDLLGFPLVDLFENRDYKGSTHFFFDLGLGNTLAFFDFPGLGLEPGGEAIGGIHHLAISVPPEQYTAIVGRLDEAGIAYQGPDLGVAGSVYFHGPDGELIEITNDPLLVLMGRPVGED